MQGGDGYQQSFCILVSGWEYVEVLLWLTGVVILRSSI